MSTKVRTNHRLEVTGEQLAFLKKAVKAQADQIEALTEWPAIIPYSKEYVVQAHAEILTKIDDLSNPVEVKTRTRTPKNTGAVAGAVAGKVSQAQPNGARV